MSAKIPNLRSIDANLFRIFYGVEASDVYDYLTDEGLLNDCERMLRERYPEGVDLQQLAAYLRTSAIQDLDHYEDYLGWRNSRLTDMWCKEYTEERRGATPEDAPSTKEDAKCLP